MVRATISLFALTLMLAVALLETTAMAEPKSVADPDATVARGDRRKEIKSLDIHDRPNRPLHFYGNTVRRRSSRT